MELFKRSQPPVIGVDMSSSAIKVIQLSRSASGYRVEHYASEPMPATAIVDRNISDPEIAAEALRRAIARSGSRAKHAAAAVPVASAIVKTIAVAKDLSEDEVEAQLELEAPNYIPFPVEEIAMDFEMQGATPGNPESTNVLLAAARNETVDVRSSVLELAGLTPVVMDIDVFALENAYELIADSLRLQEGAVVALAHIGGNNTVLHVLRNGRTIYTREQPFGGRQLTEEIMRRYGLGFEEAEQAKRRGGLPDGYAGEILEPFKTSVVQQIGRLLQFFYAGSEFNRVDQVVLAGGTAALPGLAGAVEEQLGLRAVVANPLAHMTFSNRLAGQQLESEGPGLLTACGLALRGFDP